MILHAKRFAYLLGAALFISAALHRCGSDTNNTQHETFRIVGATH